LDGNLDVVAANNTQDSVSVFLGNGDGTFQPRQDYQGAATGPMASGDFNGDGCPDIAIPTTTGVSVLLGGCDGILTAFASYPTGVLAFPAKAADLTGDGILDLAVVNNNGDSVSVLTGNGDGTFQAPLTYGSGGFPHQLAIADLNRDGRPDLLVTAG